MNHGGDSDSTGSLTGQLLGVQQGAGVIPPEWLDELEGRDVVEQVAEDLIRHFVVSSPSAEEDDFERYPPN